MEYGIEIVGVLEIDEEDLKQCRALTFRDGQMRRCIDELRKEGRARAKRSRAFMAKDSSGRVLGWALCFENRFGRREVYVYVDEEHRRQGIGSALVTEVRRVYPRFKILVRPWDGKSFLFYERFPRLVPQGSIHRIEELRRKADKLRQEERENEVQGVPA